MDASQKCPLCQAEATCDALTNLYSCTKCGEFTLNTELATEFHPSIASELRNFAQSADVAAELRVRIHDANAMDRRPVLTRGQLQAVRPLSVVDRADRMLTRLATSLSRPGDLAQIKFSEPWRFGAYDSSDVRGLTGLLEQRGDICDTKDAQLLHSFALRLTATGWARAAELTRTTTGRQAFVAMSFTPEMMAIRASAFDPAIRNAGYEPFLVSDREHNGRIDDRIEYEIKNSVFVVADFTDLKGGVYYEAGFAQGLGKPVIWTVHARDIGKLHFDTRQFNHIVWTEADDLRNRLEARILNTVGKGPAV